MNKTHLSYLLLVYLGSLLLLQTELQLSSVLRVIIPLIVIAIGVQTTQKPIAIIGFTGWLLFGLSLLVIPSMDNLVFITLQVIISIFPSMLLLSILLQLEHRFTMKMISKKPLIGTLALFFIFLFVFYSISLIINQSTFLAEDTTELQILFLGSLTMAMSTPVLFWKKQDTKNSM